MSHTRDDVCCTCKLMRRAVTQNLWFMREVVGCRMRLRHIKAVKLLLVWHKIYGVRVGTDFEIMYQSRIGRQYQNDLMRQQQKVSIQLPATSRQPLGIIVLFLKATYWCSQHTYQDRFFYNKLKL